MKRIHLYYLDYIVLILYGFLVAIDILSGTRLNYPMSFDTCRTCVEGCLLILGLIKVFINFDQDRRKAIFAIAFLVSAIVLKNVVHIDYWNIVVAVFAAYNTDFELIAKTHLSVVIIVLSVVFVSAYTGLSRETFEDTGASRVISKLYDIGMTNHSWFMMYWLFGLLCILYIIRNYRYKFGVVLILEVITILLWLRTGSNTSTITGISCCVIYQLLIILDKFKNDVCVIVGKLIKKISVVMPVIAIVATAVGVLVYGIHGYGSLPTTMMNRFKNIIYTLELYGVKLPFDVAAEPYNDVHFNWLLGAQGNDANIGYEMDNLYGLLFIFGGGIVCVSYIILQIYVRCKVCKLNDYLLLLILSAISIFDICESRAFTTSGCLVFSLLLFSELHSDKKDWRPKQSDNTNMMGNV